MNSETRIEIAERMRGLFDVCECDGRALINGTLFGMQVCARDELELRNGMRHLAELIDPTCKMEEHSARPQASGEAVADGQKAVRRDRLPR